MSFIDVAIIQCHNIKNGTPIIEPISFTIRYWTFSRTGGKSSILNRWNKDMRKALTNPLVIRSLSTTGRKWALSPIMTSGVRAYLPRRFHMDWNLFGFLNFVGLAYTFHQSFSVFTESCLLSFHKFILIPFIGHNPVKRTLCRRLVPKIIFFVPSENLPPKKKHSKTTSSMLVFLSILPLFHDLQGVSILDRSSLFRNSVVYRAATRRWGSWSIASRPRPIYWEKQAQGRKTPICVWKSW